MTQPEHRIRSHGFAKWPIPLVVLGTSVTLVLVLVVAHRVSHQDPAAVMTTGGPIRGVVGSGHRQFDGIPYAAPPVGAKRWLLPESPEPWEEERDATRPQARCSQPDDEGGIDAASSEDCLYLNITTPSVEAMGDGPAPVMVWFHGGAFSSGAGSDYDPRRLAEHGGVVVITVNSRLGIMGHFAHPDLPDSGTYGIADQQAALRWVRENAAAFGGDPSTVTLFGNSSGGANICGHLASPASAGLFHRAIIQSGGCHQNWRPNVMFPDSDALTYWSHRETAAQQGAEAADGLGCGPKKPLDCLREASPEDLLPFNGQFLTMSYGTPLIPLGPEESFADGKYNKVPILLGNNRDEHRLFARFFDIDEEAGLGDFRSLLDTSFGRSSHRIAENYPVDDSPHSVELNWAAVGTDSGWVCPTLRSTLEFARHAPTFSYEFADPHPPRDPIFPPGFPQGTPHGAEVPYLLGLGNEDLGLTDAQQQLSNRMINYWSAFARDGRPAPPEAWPPVSGPHPTALRLEPTGDSTSDPTRDHQCDFWHSVP